MFSNTERENLKHIAQLYGKVKELIIFCEENHDEFKSNLHVVKELRDAFDHLMRIFAVKLDIKEEKDGNYIEINMEKVFGHVYRAGYDTLDFAAIILRDKINKEVIGFSSSAIQAAIPTYYSEVRPSVENITSDIIKLRINKDVANPSAEVFESYFQKTIKLQEILEKIRSAKPAIVEYENKKHNEKLKNTALNIVVGILIGVVLVIIGLFFK
ncbi:Uncharacterised protein [uncultured archaeon]|nr:Uncharacterised protein [uncultured archaeon]